MMKGIMFDDIHSYYDLNLVLSAVNIPPAGVKTSFVNIPGGDGSWDMTEALGKVNFKDRSCTFTFSVLPGDDFEEKKTEVSNLLNGRRCKITLDKDPDYHWIGRCSVNSYETSKKLRKITVGATVAPYKLKNDVTKEIVYLCGKNLFDPTRYFHNAGTSAYYENGTVYVNYSGYNGLVLRFGAIPVNPENSYVFSYDVVGGDRIVISFFDKDGNNISEHASSVGSYLASYSGRYAAVGDGLPIPMTSDVASIQFGLCAMNTVGEGNFNEYSNIQLEISEDVTEFEPYTPNADPQEITLINARKTVCPTIICTGEANINADGAEFEVGVGTIKILDFQLKQGDNIVSVSGDGILEFRYQEGDL